MTSIIRFPTQVGADLSVPVRPDQGGSGQVQQRAAGLESGGAQEHGLVELHRASFPHAAAGPEAYQVNTASDILKLGWASGRGTFSKKM